MEQRRHVPKEEPKEIIKPIPGPKGEKGEKGDKGNSGIDGLKGEKGSDGIGLFGPQGPIGPKGNIGERGEQGEKGEKGDTGSGGSATIDVLANEDIGAYLPVIATGYVANSTVLGHRMKVIGVSTTDTLSGFNIPVQTIGQLSNPVWNWTIGDRIYINQNALSKVSPTSDNSIWLMQIGVAIKPDTIIIDLKSSILL